MSGNRLDKKSKSRVSFAVDDEPKTRLDIMKDELERLRCRDEEHERRYEEHRQEEIRKARAAIEKEKVDKGLQLIPGSRLSKQEIQKILGKEEKCMLKEERMKVAAETAQMKNTVGMKHGFHTQKKAPDLMELAVEFSEQKKSSNVLGLPDRIVRELTVGEIMDLKKVFDMYDLAGTGYIRRKDVYKLVAVLGYRFSRDSCYRTLDKVVKDPVAKVTFVNFLDFIIQEQEGSDPFEEVQKCFRILDQDNKGYLTFDDLRTAANDTDCQLSNRQIMEMLDEADTSGDAKVNLEEFTIIMLRTSAFNF